MKIKEREKRVSPGDNPIYLKEASMIDMERCVRDLSVSFDRLTKGKDGKDGYFDPCDLMPWAAFDHTFGSLRLPLVGRWKTPCAQVSHGEWDIHLGTCDFQERKWCSASDLSCVAILEDLIAYKTALNALFQVASRMSTMRIAWNREYIDGYNRDAFKLRRVFAPGDITIVINPTDETSVPGWVEELLEDWRRSCWSLSSVDVTSDPDKCMKEGFMSAFRYPFCQWENDLESEYRHAIERHPAAFGSFMWMLLATGGLTPEEYVFAIDRASEDERYLAFEIGGDARSAERARLFWRPFFQVHRVQASFFERYLWNVVAISPSQYLPEYWDHCTFVETDVRKTYVSAKGHYGPGYYGKVLAQTFGRGSLVETMEEFAFVGYPYEEAKGFFVGDTAFLARAFASHDIDIDVYRGGNEGQVRARHEIVLRYLYEFIPACLDAVYGKKRTFALRGKASRQ